jgi:hypothetical protein
MGTDYSTISLGDAYDLAKRVGDTLLAERYRDPTHFVYELLQNAEDALKERHRELPEGAFSRRVRFDLLDDRLELRHFGIPFSKEHIEAICDIARSSKTSRDDIQHFGIGFKSVYAFTKSPQIHSGDEHFWIKSYVRPYAVAPRQVEAGETLFVFPFDHPEKTPSEAHSEIAERLRDLGLKTLLFLRWVDEVEWKIDKRETGRYARKLAEVEAGVRRFELTGEENGRTLRNESWFVFHRSADFAGRIGRTLDVAFQLASKSKKSVGEIKRVKDSPLIALFSTDVQTSLGFLIQGPYELTPSRDNLDLVGKKAREVNKQLVRETAKLVADALLALKAHGLLTVSALDALPLDAEVFQTDSGKFFAPIFEAVKQALKKKPLIPGIGKKFVSGADGVLVRGREFADLFNREQLKLLLGSDNERDWISPDITGKKSTRRLYSYLRDDLHVEELDADALTWKLTDDFLSSQVESWFARLYRFLLKHPSLWSEGAWLRQKSIIRLADGSNVQPFGSDGANAFLPSENEAGPKTVHPKLARGDALTFLRKLGIRERDSVSEVLEDILPQYQSGERPAEPQHLRNLRRILLALENKDSPDHKLLAEKLGETAFLRAENAKSGKVKLQSPSSLIYFRTPELSLYFEGASDAWFVVESLVFTKTKDRDWLTKLGVAESPSFLNEWEGKEKVTERRREKMEAGGRFKELSDFHLHGLDGILRRIRKLNRTRPKQATQLAKLLWAILYSKATTDGESNHFEGRLVWKKYYHQRSEVETFDPWFVERLREEAWLPDQKGQFHRPSEMQQRRLPLGFERCQKLCEVLQFQTPLLEKLKQAGVPAKLAKVLELAQSDPQFADEFCRTYKRRGAVVQAESAEVNAGTTAPSGSGTVDGVTNEEDTAHRQQGVSAPRTDFLQTRIRVSPRNASVSTVESLEMAALRSKADRAGIAQVKTYEQKEGRVVEELAHNHPGYDLLSKDKSGEILRYIEVKSTGADWNGILLSPTQFREAQRLGELYWLYVVENTESPNPRVYPIQNPAGLAEKFIFDNGWKAVSEALSNLARRS